MAYFQKGEKEFCNCNTATLQHIELRNVKNYPAQNGESVQKRRRRGVWCGICNHLIISALQMRCFVWVKGLLLHAEGLLLHAEVMLLHPKSYASTDENCLSVKNGEKQVALF